MLIFPEGTRSLGGELLPFGRAAFEMACRARVPVLSLTITCEPAWLSKEQPLFDPPKQTPQLRLATLAIDDPARVDYDSRQLCRLIEDRYQQWSRGLRP
jgi:1-acyl-sn-glycerol-3-phosphate acyltransferase